MTSFEFRGAPAQAPLSHPEERPTVVADGSSGSAGVWVHRRFDDLDQDKVCFWICVAVWVFALWL